MADQPRTTAYTAQVVPSGFTDVPMAYSNFTLIQASPDEVMVLFFQAEAPYLRKQEEAATIREIPARCIARFALSLTTAERLRTSLNEALGALKQAAPAAPPPKV